MKDILQNPTKENAVFNYSGTTQNDQWLGDITISW